MSPNADAFPLAEAPTSGPIDNTVSPHVETPTTETPKAPAIKIPRRSTDTVSISTPAEYKITKDIFREVVPLTQELLEQYWNRFIDLNKDNAKITDLMQGRKLVLKDQNLFNVIIPNIILENDFRQFQTELINYIRTESGHPLLNMKMLVELPKSEKKIYLPHEKFEAMVEQNPAMVALKGLFNEIDF